MILTRNNLITLFITLGLSIVICLFIRENILCELLEKLVFNAVSILVGLSISVIGIFLSSINTVYLSIYKMIKVNDKIVFTNEEIKGIKENLSELVDELKENALFSLYIFIAVLLMFFLKEMDIPHVRWFIQDSFISKVLCFNVLILAGNFLIFYSIIDSVKVVFDITKSFELAEDD